MDLFPEEKSIVTILGADNKKKEASPFYNT